MTTVQLLKKSGTRVTKQDKATAHLDELQKVGFLVEGLNEETAKAKALELYEKSDQTYFVLGGLLDAIYTNAWHTGYEGFKDYVEDNFGMKIRKAMYLMKFYNDVIENELPWDRIKHLGWSKVRVLSAILTLENLEELVAKAENMTVRQLMEFVKAEQAAEFEDEDGEIMEEETSDLSTLSLRVHSDQKETILDAIAAAKDVSGTEFDGVALEYVCMDYLGGSSGEVTSLAKIMASTTPELVLESFEKVFPEVRITINN